MSGASEDRPEGYEILKTIERSGSVSEHVARHKADDALVRLKIFDFSQTSSATTRRHIREYLRCDITFMEELELQGIIQIFDYSDTKDLFWMATQPARIDKLSKRFDFLGSQSFEFRRELAGSFLATLERIHNSSVVHRNLSSDAVFLSSDLQIFIGDFGFSSYFTDHPTATHQDTSAVTTLAYQPPEVRNAQTFTCDVSCDIFSAGLLVFEILSATALAKDNPARIHELLVAGLNEQTAKDIISTGAAEVILRAANPSPEKRWASAADFAMALEKSLRGEPGQIPAPIEPASTRAITEQVRPSETMPAAPAADVDEEPSEPSAALTEAPEGITPLDASHEIWNDHYEIIEKIGEGGQAVVYKAYDHLTNEEIAIKTIWSRHRKDRAAINRLKQGAMIARSLTHRYIIKTYSVEQRIEADSASRYVFIVMELIKSQLELGDVIEARRTTGKKIRVEEALHVTRQLLDALAYAHEHTIHRDIKPGNIMLVPRQEQAEPDTSDLTKFDIRLIDFGIAKVLSQKHIDVTGKGFRSAHYGAPELADAKTGVDARADIFSTGVILYQMLTKTIPRKGSPPANKVNKEVPAALAKVIDKAINADREKRFRKASELIREIDRAVSKFRWVRKAAKIAAVLVVGVCSVAAAKYFLPEPDRLPLQKSMEILEGRIPDREIAAFDEQTVIKYSDIEGYDSYDGLKRTGLESLKMLETAGTERFKRSFPPWNDQEEAWVEIEPAIGKVERIARDRQEFIARKDLAVAAPLMELSPSREVLSEVTDKTKKAEALLEDKPFSHGDLDDCVDAYDLGARVFENLEAMAEGSDAAETAVEINNKLTNVNKLRSSFLLTHSSLDTITQLKGHGFEERREECLKKADRYYRSFDLVSANKYFGLLNQICGTITHVRDQVDFKRSDIGLISSRLMELCNQDVDTFEEYPEWKERLEQVYVRKDILAKYKLIQTLLSRGPKDVPLTVYDLTVSARKEYEQGNIDSAGARLAAATRAYKKFIGDRIDELRGDCDSLATFSFVSAESVQEGRSGLEELSRSLDEPGWPQQNFADEYNRCEKIIADEKDAVREQMIQQARNLRGRIVVSNKKAQQQSFFWNSRLISRYIAVARQYDRDDIDSSIAKWRYVEDLARLSKIVDGMREIDTRLENMLARKDDLDQLASDIDEGISFCERFKGITDEERKQYKQWVSDLKQLRGKLSARQNNKYLIDQSDDVFASERDATGSAFSEIRAKLPYYRSRVIELIKKIDYLEQNALNVSGLQKHWADLLGQPSISTVKSDFNKTRDYLESVKDEVDKWDWRTDRFNREMRQKCSVLADALYEQSRAAASIISGVLAEESRLVDGINSFETRVNEILSDADIRKLEGVAATDRREALLKFRQLPSVLGITRQKFSKVVLAGTAPIESIMPEDGSVDFDVNTWLIGFNAKDDQLDAQVSQLQAINDTVSIFQETRQILARQSAMEKDYYLGLRDCTLSLIDYSDVGSKIDAAEADSVIAGMCTFLEQMNNDAAPRLGDLKTSVVGIGRELTNLKAVKISTLSEAKDFNGKREQLLDRIAGLRQEVAKLDKANLEAICRKSVAEGVTEIGDLIGRSGQADRLRRLTSSLWAFFPDHKDWSQWVPFLKLYHVVVSNEDVRLIRPDTLRPVNEKGDYLGLREIATDPARVFQLDVDNSFNFGWPRYVCHQEDPAVILAFVPGTDSGGMEPFYMAVRETTNAQYKLFMEKTGARSLTKLTGWSCFGDKKGSALISQVQGQFPPSRITWDKSATAFVVEDKFERVPVTWVTFGGGQAYAQWLGAQLPTVKQYAYAARAGSSTPYPWGDDLSDAATWAHVRSTAWQRAARDYNAKRDNPVEIAYPPVGAVKDFLVGKALDPAKTVHKSNSDYPVWPCFTENSKPNAWGLYDMIGNVWEWCTDAENDSKQVVCGGSCLCPPKYVGPESKYEFKGQACDVGFRIVVPAK